MTRRFSRAISAAAAFAAAFGASGASLAQTTTWQANDDDYLLLQPVVGSYKLTTDVRGYQTDSGICLDLADVIQSLNLPIRLDKKSRRATGWLFAEDQTITIDRSSNTVQNVNNENAPVNHEIYDTPEGWCVDSQALSRWLGIDFKPDLYNALVRLESERKMPFLEAIERKSRAEKLRPKRQAFDLSKYPHAEMDYKMWRTPSVDVVARAGYRSDAPKGSRSTAQVELYAAGELGKASYTARLATNNDLEPDSLRIRAYRHDADGGMLGPLSATQVAAGDVQTISSQLTGQTAVGRGAFVSNQPLEYNSRFSETTLRGVLPAGWDAELYRNGQLLAFQSSSADGRYEFVDIDLYYGRNDLEVVLYGPQGQIRREKSSFPVGLNNIEPGQTYYWAGILQDDRDLIDLGPQNMLTPHEWRWGMGLERGLDQKTSVGFGLQSLWYNGRRRDYVETTLWRTVGPMMVEWASAHEFGSGGITQLNALGQLGRFNFGLQASKGFGEFSSERTVRALDHEFALQIDTSIKLGKLSLPLQVSGRHTKQRDGTSVKTFQTRTAITTRVVALSTEFFHESRSGPGSGGGQDRNQLRLLANSRLFGLRLRGNAVYELSGPFKGFDTARLTAEKRLTDRSEMAAEVEFLSRQDTTRFSLGYTRFFDKFALRTDATLGTNGAVGGNVSLSFSFGPDPRGGGIRFSESKLARNGQAAVTVFRDENGDGRRSPDEEILPEIRVEAGLRRSDAVTDENGQTVLDRLRPFIPVVVGIDESSLDDPFLAAGNKGIVVVPRPGIATKIELPVAPSGEVEGVLLNVSGVEISGVTLELVDRVGNVVATTFSEFDGFFLFQRVPYGEYRVRVADDSARTLDVSRALGDPLEIKRGADIARLGAVKLQSGRMVVASSDVPAGSE